MVKALRGFPIKWKLLLNNNFKERECGPEGGKPEFISEEKAHGMGEQRR